MARMIGYSLSCYPTSFYNFSQKTLASLKRIYTFVVYYYTNTRKQ